MNRQLIATKPSKVTRNVTFRWSDAARQVASEDSLVRRDGGNSFDLPTVTGLLGTPHA